MRLKAYALARLLITALPPRAGVLFVTLTINTKTILATALAETLTAVLLICFCVCAAAGVAAAVTWLAIAILTEAITAVLPFSTVISPTALIVRGAP